MEKLDTYYCKSQQSNILFAKNFCSPLKTQKIKEISLQNRSYEALFVESVKLSRSKGNHRRIFSQEDLKINENETLRETSHSKFFITSKNYIPRVSLCQRTKVTLNPQNYFTNYSVPYDPKLQKRDLFNEIKEKLSIDNPIFLKKETKFTLDSVLAVKSNQYCLDNLSTKSTSPIVSNTNLVECYVPNFNCFNQTCEDIKNKKRYVEREGDWICEKCRNMNFSFRFFCNRCKMAKIEENLSPNLKQFAKINDIQFHTYENEYKKSYIQ